jgi:hypothetical protein
MIFSQLTGSTNIFVPIYVCTLLELFPGSQHQIEVQPQQEHTLSCTGCERYCRPFFKVVCGLNRSSDCDVIQSADPPPPTVLRSPSVDLAVTMNRQLQECVRGAIVTGISARRTNREIADFNISVNTVKSFSREYHRFIEEGGQDEDFDIKRKQHRRRSDAHGVEIVEKV